MASSQSRFVLYPMACVYLNMKECHPITAKVNGTRVVFMHTNRLPNKSSDTLKKKKKKILLSLGVSYNGVFNCHFDPSQSKFAGPF